MRTKIILTTKTEDSININQEKKDTTKDLEKDNTYEVNSNDKEIIIDKRPRRNVKPKFRYDECGEESNKWKEAMNSLEKNNTWKMDI